MGFLRRLPRPRDGSVIATAGFFLLLNVLLVAVSPVQAELGGAMELTKLQMQFRTIADQLAPSVVAISVSSSVADSDDALRADSMNGEKLERVLAKTTRTVGTGFVIDPDGYILTNEHVIGEAAQIWATTDDGAVYPAVVVGSDPRADLAVLKLPARGMQPVKWGSAGAAERGMWTIALGNPFGFAAAGEMSMSVGVVSALHRSLPKLNTQENRFYADLIQTTAEINPGNSGGPLFDLDGNVIGVSTAVIMPQKQSNGIGFAIPVTNELLTRIDNLKNGKEVVYAYLGVMVQTPTSRQRKTAGIGESVGVLIERVEENSPGEGTFEKDDIVLAIDERGVRESDEFVRMVGNASVEQPTRFLVRRDGKTFTLPVQLRPRQLPSVAVSREKQRMRWRGMLLGPVPANWEFPKSSNFIGQGLMVLGIDSENPVYKQGVRSGAVITSVAGKPVSCVTDLQTIVNDTPAELCSIEATPLVKQAVASGE